MNRMLISISFAALLAAVPALADDHKDQNHNGGDHPAPQAHEQHAPGGGHAAGPGGHMAAPDNHMAGPMSAPAAPPAHAAPPAPHPAVNNAMMMHSEGEHHHGNGMAHDNGMEQMNGMAHSNAAANPAAHANAMSEHGNGQHGNGQHGNGMSHMGGMGNAPHANHANFGALHRNFTAPRRFHAGAYHRPHGYYAHRWSFGERLPTAFFVRNYWIDDFYDYGLMDPPPGTVWVRYGDDALLVDEYTGEVIQVEYNVFF